MPERSAGVLPAAARDAAIQHRTEPLGERMKAVSTPLLDLPYVSDPLGEGQSWDVDPLARYDAFDCLTFVEEVLALSLAGDPDHAAPIRLDLRYGANGAVDYTNRNHFMELQWIPDAIQRGWLRDITTALGPTTSFEQQVDSELWKHWRSRVKFAHKDDELPTGVMHLEVLGIDDALAAADRIPVGALILTVRAQRPGVPIWITHLGFKVDSANVRHATRMQSRRTRDHDLRWYLEHLKTYTNWPAAGIVVLQPIEFGPRLSRLPQTSNSKTPDEP